MFIKLVLFKALWELKEVLTSRCTQSQVLTLLQYKAIYFSCKYRGDSEEERDSFSPSDHGAGLWRMSTILIWRDHSFCLWETISQEHRGKDISRLDHLFNWVMVLNKLVLFLQNPIGTFFLNKYIFITIPKNSSGPFFLDCCNNFQICPYSLVFSILLPV